MSSIRSLTAVPRTAERALAPALLAALVAGACSSSGDDAGSDASRAGGDGVAAGDVSPMTVAAGGSDEGSGGTGSAPAGGGDPEGGAGDGAADGDTPGGEATGGGTGNAGADPGTPATLEASARYRLEFDATWSADTHPAGFPDEPHFSPLVGAVHNEQVRLWEPGQLATGGVRTVAETGNPAPMLDEVRAAIGSGYALAEIAGGGVPSSPGTQSVEFEVTPDYPEITVITMLAPSPDWFAGVRGLSLLDEDGFVERAEVELALYDAGTDDGPGYTSADDPTEPPGIIERVSSRSGDSPFVDGGPAIGRFTIERVR